MNRSSASSISNLQTVSVNMESSNDDITFISGQAETSGVVAAQPVRQRQTKIQLMPLRPTEPNQLTEANQPNESAPAQLDSESDHGAKNEFGISEIVGSVSNGMLYPNYVPKDVIYSRDRKSRAFLFSWTALHPWLRYNTVVDRAFCADCSHLILHRPDISITLKTRTTKLGFVLSQDGGFNQWSKGAQSLKSHATSDVHKECVSTLSEIHHGNRMDKAMESVQKTNGLRYIEVIKSIRFIDQGQVMENSTRGISSDC